jgi:phospholipid transport system transporter-binding protein
MMDGAPAAPEGSFASADGRWTFTGTLTFADAATVFEASRALPLPAAGIVDLAGMEHADSAALALMLALKRRAAVEGAHLAFKSIPQGLHALAHVYGIEEMLAAS